MEGFLNPPAILKMAKYDDNYEDPGYTFSDDPTMVSTIYQNQQDSSQRVKDTMRATAAELFSQLKSLNIDSEAFRRLIPALTQQFSGNQDQQNSEQGGAT